MKYVINGRKTASVFRFFEEISAIPRPSYYESGVADYLEGFAQARGLECYRDGQNNVLIKAPASAGFEDHAPILFQGHTDMVCEKNADVEHDFLRDPIELWVDGDLLRAKGTTLGADNGIAVAMMLALLDGDVAEHPAYECLFTTAEEVGLDGANAFDYTRVRARRMVNLDSEKLGVVTCGCAGGIRSDLTLKFTPESFVGDALRVSIGGLMGGHSGENINCGRANANKLMGRLLAMLSRETDMRVVSIEGGSKDNAIPRECTAILSVPNAEAATVCLTDAAAEIAAELVYEDRGFSVSIEDTDAPVTMLSRADTARVCAILACAANGVLAMSREVPSLVEFSRNLGVIRTEGDTLCFVFSSRSALESQLDASIAELDALAAVTGCETKHHGRYPGWAFAPTSPLRDVYLDAYRRVTGKDASVQVIHAGLECGIIYSHLPDMDIISIGPNLFDIHSPAEAMSLSSVETVYETLAALLRLL